MPAAYSQDLREKVMKAYENGQTVKEIEHNFSVEKTFIYNLLTLVRETGSIEPRKRIEGKKSKLSNEQFRQIDRKIQEQPDKTLQEIKEELNLPICISALCRIINNKLGLSRKKNIARCSPE